MKSVKIAGAVGLLFGICLSSQATTSLAGGTGSIPLDTPITSYSFAGPNGIPVTSWEIKNLGQLLGDLSYFSEVNNTASPGSAVGFNYAGGAGQVSGTLVVNTPAQTFWFPVGSVIDKNSFVLVPEPSALLAGALLLIPFAATTLRVVRKR